MSWNWGFAQDWPAFGLDFRVKEKSKTASGYRVSSQWVLSTWDLIARAPGTSVGPESMFDPATSIRFSAYYLGEMSRRFGGDSEYLVAAYHGGPTTVQRTLDNLAVGDKNDFYRWLTKAQSWEFLNRVMLNSQVYRCFQDPPTRSLTD